MAPPRELQDQTRNLALLIDGDNAQASLIANILAKASQPGGLCVPVSTTGERKDCMRKVHERFVTNCNGRRTAVLLDMVEYEKLLQELEELECLKSCDAAKSSADEVIPLDQALAEIEERR